MPIKVYVSRDSEGRPWPPDNDHEASACIDVMKRLWTAFASQPTLYTVAVNLHQPSADFVTLSEHGIGVLEPKHCFGSIWQTPDDTWYADEMLIKSGVQEPSSSSAGLCRTALRQVDSSRAIASMVTRRPHRLGQV